ncbi:MAG: SIMPL domain-containing protein [Tropicimonas sp.]|uniref:SIMPL domain-containing protein n=1 Tax=Tropicimonas sp. TaxID=2067044 RepID=UPI003A837A50
MRRTTRGISRRVSRRVSRGIAVLALLLPAALAGAQEVPQRLVTVTGQGRFAAAPDMATVSLGVLSETPEAAAAIGDVRDGLSAILAHLGAAGIAAADIQTSQLSLDPRWDDRPPGDDGRRIRSFVANGLLTVRLREIEALGALLDQLGAEVNNLQGVSFGLQDPRPAEDAARRAAVADARHRAELYAEAAGVALGPVLSISEGGGAQPYMMRNQVMEFAAASMPVAPGEVEFTASVTVTYGLAAAPGEEAAGSNP